MFKAQKGVIMGGRGSVRYVLLHTEQGCAVCQQDTQMAVHSKVYGLLGTGYLRLCETCLEAIKQLDPTVYAEIKAPVDSSEVPESES